MFKFVVSQTEQTLINISILIQLRQLRKAKRMVICKNTKMIYFFHYKYNGKNSNKVFEILISWYKCFIHFIQKIFSFSLNFLWQFRYLIIRNYEIPECFYFNPCPRNYHLDRRVLAAQQRRESKFIYEVLSGVIWILYNVWFSGREMKRKYEMIQTFFKHPNWSNSHIPSQTSGLRN